MAFQRGDFIKGGHALPIRWGRTPPPPQRGMFLKGAPIPSAPIPSASGPSARDIISARERDLGLAAQRLKKAFELYEGLARLVGRRS